VRGSQLCASDDDVPGAWVARLVDRDPWSCLCLMMVVQPYAGLCAWDVRAGGDLIGAVVVDPW